MNNILRNTLIGIVIGYAVGCSLATIANGQEYDVTTEDGTALEGEGFQGSPPTYLILLKVESRHSGDFLGSGCFLSDRLVLTCFHNVRGLKSSDKIGVHLTSGTVYRNTKVVATAPRYDLALILIDETVPMEYHRRLTVSGGESSFVNVAMMGFSPSHNALRLTQGQITGRKYGNKWGTPMVYFDTTAEFVQGMSGGPVINPGFELVGVGVSSDGKSSQATMLHRIQSFLTSYKGDTGSLED